MSALIRFHYYPFEEFGGMFKNALNANSHLDSFHPRLDLHESKDSNIVTATFELPGLKSEDVTIDVHHDRLTISGETSVSTSNEEGGYAVRERRRGKFSRVLRLPIGIKPEDVQAKMENGLLTVTFPRASPEQQPQRIAIL